MLLVKAVETAADWQRFIDFPWSLYKNNRHWVPPLRMDLKDMLLNTKGNPFYAHAERQGWLVFRDARLVGRIAAIKNDAHNETHLEKVGFAGFFECEDDPAAARLLFDAASDWARARALTALRGPVNLSTNHECGLLVQGFDDAPTYGMTYNPPYYQRLLEQAGFSKAKDLFAYELRPEMEIDGRMARIAERLMKREGITFRSVNMKRFSDELELLLKVYNDAWEKNWGFVPMSPDEFRYMAKDMKSVADPDLILLAEVRGKPAGFSLTLPDINQALKHVKDGRLFPLGALKLLWHLKGPRRSVNRLRILTLGIAQEFRQLGLGPLFYTEIYRRGIAKGYTRGEAGWILEDNVGMNGALEKMGALRSKVYRIYERAL